MELFYYVVFGTLASVVATVELSKCNKDRINTSSAFNSFRNNYLLVYSLMMASDWLLGIYVHYLYNTYGFGKGETSPLFIAGFGSSMLFGAIVGSLADNQERKRACVTYCITYILSGITQHSHRYKALTLGRILGGIATYVLSCITKHSLRYKVLMVGRILGGIATTLLFSEFESWLLEEHFNSSMLVTLM